MIILFSPSEGKKTGGDGAVISKNTLLFPECYTKRKEIIERYNHYVNEASQAELSKFFGLKDLAQIQHYCRNIFEEPTMKAVERYNGVAYDYLKYSELESAAQKYVDTHTIIFSNLFGPLSAGDMIPEYKLKQGEKIDDFAVELFYKKEFSVALDEYVGNAPILDLRAGFYEKFYKPTTEYMTLKFMKNGKVISHWAKAYRGVILRDVARNKIKTFESFMKMEVEGIMIKEILKKNNKTEIVYDIIP